MVVGIMQPYLFPYPGYFQLIRAVDTFVVYDDVQYIKGGWVNRNRILCNGAPALFTFSVRKASTFLPINARFFSARFNQERDTFFKTLRQNYSSAPCYRSAVGILESCLEFDLKATVADNIAMNLKFLCGRMGIKTTMVRSSDLQIADTSGGVERVVAICKALGASDYVNAPGGRSLYTPESFTREGLSLTFIRPIPRVYTQFNGPFVANLSIIDALMFNLPAEMEEILKSYELDRAEQS